MPLAPPVLPKPTPVDSLAEPVAPRIPTLFLCVLYVSGVIYSNNPGSAGWVMTQHKPPTGISFPMKPAGTGRLPQIPSTELYGTETNCWVSTQPTQEHFRRYSFPRVQQDFRLLAFSLCPLCLRGDLFRSPYASTGSPMVQRWPSRMTLR